MWCVYFSLSNFALNGPKWNNLLFNLKIPNQSMIHWLYKIFCRFLRPFVVLYFQHKSKNDSRWLERIGYIIPPNPPDLNILWLHGASCGNSNALVIFCRGSDFFSSNNSIVCWTLPKQCYLLGDFVYFISKGCNRIFEVFRGTSSFISISGINVTRFSNK